MNSIFGYKIIKNKKILQNYENVLVLGTDTSSQLVRAKVDTGANRTSIDSSVAEKLGLLTKGNIIEKKIFYSGLGQQERYIVACTFELAKKRITTEVSVSNRSHMKHKMIIGRRDIADFLVQPAKKQEK